MSQINKVYNSLKAKRFWLGTTEVTATADELNALDGVTASVAELNLVDNQVAGASFTIGSETSEAITVNVQLEDAAGAAMATASAVKFYLADDDAGLTPSTDAPSSGIAAGTDGAMIENVDNLSGWLISEADGDIDVALDTTASGEDQSWYLVLVMPNGSLVVSDVIDFD